MLEVCLHIWSPLLLMPQCRTWSNVIMWWPQENGTFLHTTKTYTSSSFRYIFLGRFYTVCNINVHIFANLNTAKQWRPGVNQSHSGWSESSLQILLVKLTVVRYCWKSEAWYVTLFREKGYLRRPSLLCILTIRIMLSII